MLVLEDMHWADRSTRAFVAFLARSLRSERLFVLLSYRTDELYRRHPLRPLLAELERLDRARLIRLEPFDRVELGEALEDILGSSPAGALLERLFARAEGNPLFTEELLAVGLDGRGAAPQSLRDAFLVRIERLASDAQRAARAVAVGYALPEAVISEATGLDPLALQEALREAMAEQILVANADGLLTFRHALLREALYDDLLPGERSDLHLCLARALEARIGQGVEGELVRSAAIAAHYAAAGDQPAALRTTIIAAESAEQARAYGEAADLLERALELWPRVPAAERPAHLDYVELLRRTSTAHAMHGHRSRSEDLLQEALGHVDAEAEPSRYADLLARLARAIWSLNRGPEAVALGERALEVLPQDDPDHLRPVLRGWLARTRFLRGRFRQAADDAEAALQEATAVGNTLAEAEVLNTLGMARVALGDAEAGIGYLKRAIEVARPADDQDSMISAYSNLADMYNMIGQTAHRAADRPRGPGAVLAAARPRPQLDEPRRGRDGLRGRRVGRGARAPEPRARPPHRSAADRPPHARDRAGPGDGRVRRRAGGAGRRRAAGVRLRGAAVDRPLRRAAGGPVPPRGAPGRGSGGDRRGPGSPRAVHRRRDADRARVGRRDRRGGRPGPAWTRPARARRGARRADPGPDPHGAPGGGGDRGRGGRAGPARRGAGRPRAGQGPGDDPRLAAGRRRLAGDRTPVPGSTLPAPRGRDRADGRRP